MDINVHVSEEPLYIRLAQGEVARTYVASDRVFIDYDADGKVIGIEILGE